MIPSQLLKLFSRLWWPLACLSPIGLFLAFFTPDVLDPTNIAWLLSGDWGQHFLGWHAFRQVPLTWPLNHEDLLAAPTGLSIIYTDSNPLFALPLRLLSPYLPAQFQYIGPWFLVCVVLHFGIAWKLVRRHAPGPWSAWAGALLLSLLPTLYNRIGHDTLVAHWLILWAIYVFFEIEGERAKIKGYMLVLTITALVHPYLLVMVLAIWSADVLRVTEPAWRTRDFSGLVRSGGAYALCLVPMILGLAVSGAFAAGQTPADSGFRYYSMGLDALVNPARRDFSLAFLRGPQGRGQTFEGFQYLGAGLIFLVGAAIWLYFRAPDSRPGEFYRRARPLLWPFIGLLVLAVTDEVRIYGVTIFGLPLPKFLLDLLAVVRASGRLFWPLAYTGIFLALVMIYRQRPRALALVLGISIGLQVIDLTPFAASIRQQTAEAASNRTIYRLTGDPRWQTLMTHASAVEMEPHEPNYDLHLFYELTYRAVTARVPVTSMYAARQNVLQKALEEQEQTRFRQGILDPTRLYVLLGKCPPATSMDRVRQLDGVWIIPPQTVQTVVTDVPVFPAFELGRTYDLDDSSHMRCYLDENWDLPPGETVQNRLASAGINLPVAVDPTKDHVLTMGIKGLLKNNRMVVSAGGQVLYNQIINKKRQDLRIVVPAALVKQGNLALQVTVQKDGARPRRKDEARGIKLYTLRLD